jgi:ABC-type multidrug transport system fused ATPase/permease subunit
LLQRFYLQTSRQVRLLEIEAKAPLFTHFIESVSGAATIRAFGWQSHYQERNCRFIDTSQRLTYLLSCIHYWLDFVLNIIVMLLSVTLVSVVVTWVEKFSAGSVGVSLVMIVGFNSMLARLIQTWTDMESSIGAVTRVKRFVEETELEDHNSTNRDLPLEWPQAGALELSGVVASYK